MPFRTNYAPQRPGRWRNRRREQAIPADPMQPFGAMAFAGESPRGRDPRILKVLKWSSPIVATVVLLGMWFVGLYLWTMVSRSQFAGENYASALSGYERQMAVTGIFPQPWLAQYNLGTAQLAAGDIDEGVENLRLSYEGVPRAIQGEEGNIQPFAYECMVRMNLSAGIEMQGDELTSDGDDMGAAEMYEEALEWVAPCEVPPSGGGGESESEGGSESESDEQNQQQTGKQGQNGNESGDRLREKLGQEPNGESGEGNQQPGGGSEGEGGGQGNSNDPFEDETPEQRERREQLEERNREHNEQQREREEYSPRRPNSGAW